MPKKPEPLVARLRRLATELETLGYDDFAEELREDAAVLAKVGGVPSTRESVDALIAWADEDEEGAT